MAHHADIHQARKNGKGSGQVPGALPINSARVVDLLVEASRPHRHFAVRRNANALLELMAQRKWRVSGGIHAGGRGRDQTSHITVSFGPGQSYHLRLDRKGQLFEITGGDLQKYSPASAPGAPATKK